MSDELEMREGQLALVDQEENGLVKEDINAEDPGLAAVIALPDYTTFNEQKVAAGVRNVFKGFSPDASGEALRFDSTDALAVYTMQTMDDIQSVRRTAEASQLSNKAAVMARFWYLGATVSNALSRGGYGTNAFSKLAAALKRSVSYIYELKAVATRLSAVDCYLLGMRGVDSTHLRRLAQIKDDAIRRGIIEAFISAYKDTSEPAKSDQARKRFIAAINARENAGAIDVTTSAPNAGGTEEAVSKEYHEAVTSMKTIQRLVKKLVDPNEVHEYVVGLEEFFLSADQPDAEEHLAAIHVMAEETRTLAAAALENLKEIVGQLDSLKGAGLD